MTLLNANSELSHKAYLQAIDIVDTSESLSDLFTKFVDHIGIKVASYHHFAGLGSFDYKKLNRYHAFNIPDSILKFYDDQKNDRRDDPGVHAVFSGGRAIWLSDLIKHPHIIKTGSADITLKALETVGDGLCIPLYGNSNRTGYAFIGFERAKQDFSSILPHQIQSLAQTLHIRYCLMVERLQAQINLTPRESEVLELLSFGKSNPEIAAILNISTNTVTGYVSRIFLKLDVSDRVSAAMRAVTLKPIA